MSYLVSFCSCVFIPFSIAITSFGEERANLNAFRTFVRFVLVWICRFPLPLGVWEGLRFVIVALPGLFSYPFFKKKISLAFILCNQTGHGLNSIKLSKFSGYSKIKYDVCVHKTYCLLTVFDLTLT